jgi:phospholipid transport system substrate-binding protein
MRRLKGLLCAALFILGLAANAASTGPRATVEGPLEAVLATLKDARYANATPELREEQRKKIRDIIRPLFDYEEISARAVGLYWKKFNPDQKKAFTEAFTELLSNTYIRRIQRNYKNEKVVFTGEEMVSSTKAVVHTKIVREGGEIRVDYSLREEGNEWRIYDINIEGVSLIRNYRSQFSQILLEESPDQLIERVRKKNAEEGKQ